jgi:cobyrinic acid a,c-diamide synthase
MLFSPPRLILSALRGGSGKTILSLGIAAAWRNRGSRVAAFKKGPDFIDAGWLSYATGQPCRNLDPFLMAPEQIVQSFLIHSSGADVSLIEGNRGLFDGLDPDGCCSTAELGRILRSPVILIIDVTMATRTVAALVMGCQKFDPELDIKGVILNRVASRRQDSVVRNAIRQYCGIPVVGSVPKLRNNLFPERHMGLVPHLESEYATRAIDWVRSVVEENLDLEALWEMSQGAKPVVGELQASDRGDASLSGDRRPRIGVIRDKAFWFYYPENLEHLERLGARIVEINAISDSSLPDLDALYIGGGFPETQAEALADNVTFKRSLKEKIELGMPVYAECGGLMYLGESLVVAGRTFPMVGAFPMDVVLEKKPQGHGYTLIEVTGINPYYGVGEVLKGHEFHYSRAVIKENADVTTVFRVRRGWGIDGTKDGLCAKNLLATYTHIHAGGNPLWASALFAAALNSPLLKENDFEDAPKRRIDRENLLGYKKKS